VVSILGVHNYATRERPEQLPHVRFPMPDSKLFDPSYIPGRSNRHHAREGLERPSPLAPDVMEFSSCFPER
jgi:hypothetical protein